MNKCSVHDKTNQPNFTDPGQSRLADFAGYSYIFSHTNYEAKRMHKTLSSHHRIIFVHRIRDERFNSEGNQEFITIPPNKKNVRTKYWQKYILTTDLFTSGNLLLSCIFTV